MNALVILLALSDVTLATAVFIAWARPDVVIGFALLHLGVLGRQRWWSRIGILLVVVGLSFAVSAWQRRDDPRDAGVILAAKASVFSGMAEEKHLLYFELHAGAEVEVLEEQDGWVKIAVGDKKGYLRREAIGIL